MARPCVLENAFMAILGQIAARKGWYVIQVCDLPALSNDKRDVAFVLDDDCVDFWLDEAGCNVPVSVSLGDPELVEKIEAGVVEFFGRSMG